jgi:hypothetical protein
MSRSSFKISPGLGNDSYYYAKAISNIVVFQLLIEFYIWGQGNSH